MWWLIAYVVGVLISIGIFGVVARRDAEETVEATMVIAALILSLIPGFVILLGLGELIVLISGKKLEQ